MSDGRSGPDISVAVVDAETPGNVGTIARAMKNFGLSELLLVDPPELDPDGEAYGFAGQAREDILPSARTVTFEEVAKTYHTVALTATTNEDARKHVRYPFDTPAELADDLRRVDGDVCLVFGRESTGLTNDELAALDRICTIPASDDYPVLNLGQAATIVLYELRDLTVGDTQLPEVDDSADPRAVEGLHDQFADFLVALGHPEEKRAKTGRLWRRLLGRADPTGREVRTLRGIFRRAGDRLRRDDSDGATGPEDSTADTATARRRDSE
jgi:TrmH family RNA methyltransferase